MNTKKIVTITIIICLVVFVGIFVGAYVLPMIQKDKAIELQKAQEKSAVTGTRVAGFAITDVAVHSKETDCWVVVDKNVYDVTNFITKHPGGKKAIIGNCGKDASIVFNSKHPISAKDTLEDYFVGVLE